MKFNRNEALLDITTLLTEGWQHSVYMDESNRPVEISYTMVDSKGTHGISYDRGCFKSSRQHRKWLQQEYEALTEVCRRLQMPVNVK